MFSTMQDEPLSLATLVEYGTTVHADQHIVTWTGTESRRTSFGEIGAQAARLAHALRGLGVGESDRVATFMWNNAEHMVAYSAVPAMGAVLHALNIRLFPEQLIYVANHAEDKVVLVDGSLVPLFERYLPQLHTVRHVIVVNGDAASLTPTDGVEVHSYAELLAAQPDRFDWPRLDERSAAAMCYTSGTTGDPKGVVYSHRSEVLHTMQVVATNGMALRQGDLGLAVVPMFHAAAWGMPRTALMVGHSLLMPDRFLQPEPLAAMIAAERPTFAAAVPTVWNGLLGYLAEHPQDITHLREVVIGGAAAAPALQRAFQERHGVPVVHAWGMTETSPLGTLCRPPAGLIGDEQWEYRYTQGRFPMGVRARLVGDNGPVPSDGKSVGELQVRGPWVAGSYYSPSGESVDADKFDDGWLRTGDVGSITPDGFLTLTDRAKDVIKSGGEWISSVELENAVMAHPDLAEAAVIGVPDAKWDERPLVAAVLREGHRATAEQLRDFLADKVAHWQLPERWTFLPEVPKTSVGKYDKKALRARYAAGELDVVTLRQ